MIRTIINITKIEQPGALFGLFLLLGLLAVFLLRRAANHRQRKSDIQLMMEYFMTDSPSPTTPGEILWTLACVLLIVLGTAAGVLVIGAYK